MLHVLPGECGLAQHGVGIRLRRGVVISLLPEMGSVVREGRA